MPLVSIRSNCAGVLRRGIGFGYSDALFGPLTAHSHAAAHKLLLTHCFVYVATLTLFCSRHSALRFGSAVSWSSKVRDATALCMMPTRCNNKQEQPTLRVSPGAEFLLAAQGI